MHMWSWVPRVQDWRSLFLGPPEMQGASRARLASGREESRYLCCSLPCGTLTPRALERRFCSQFW